MKTTTPLLRIFIITSVFSILFSIFTNDKSVIADTIIGSVLTPEFTWYDEGGDDGVRFGNSVASVDINGDGYSDAIVGSPNFKVGGDPAGAAFVYLGGPDGLDEDPYHFISPLVSGINFGISVNNAGDVNNDGYEDVIIGADNFKVDGQQGAFGGAFIYFGSPTGLSMVEYQILEGPSKGSMFGASVYGVGDVDNDGFDDVLVGAPGFPNGIDFEGAIYLYLGSADGIVLDPFWRCEGDHQNAWLGNAISGAGDLNLDGFADFVVGEHFFVTDITTIDFGKVRVFYGSNDPIEIVPGWTKTGTIYDHIGSSVTGVGDLDKNGYPDLLVGSTKSNAAYLFYNSKDGIGTTWGWTVDNEQIESLFGFSITGLGDVNLDTHPDIAVGAPYYTGDQPEEGAVFVYCGTGTGLSDTPCWIGYGDKAETEFGYSVAAGGDLNMDDRKDLLVGSPIYKRDESTKMGRAFSYHGIAPADMHYYYTYLPLVNR